MPNLNDLDLDALLTMLKGEPGTRKSTQAMTWPMPQYWISRDHKMNALLLPAQKWGIDRTQIDYDDVFNWNMSTNNRTTILSKLEQFRLNCKYKTIVVDSLTTVGDGINLQILEQNRGQTNKSGAEKGLTIGGIAVADMSDYKGEKAAFMEMMSILEDARLYHKLKIVLIAHVIGDRTDTQTGGISSMARTIISGGKAISAQLSVYNHEVYHFNAQGTSIPGVTNYSAFTQHTGGDFARTVLPLEAKIDFGDKQLYPTWIAPAIEKLKSGK